MKTKTTATMDDLQRALRAATPHAAAARLKALGLTVACGRCGGGGHYSYNAMNGTTCFGCNGRGQVVPKVTPELVDAARSAVHAGRLDAYLTRLARLARVADKIAECEAAYHATGIPAAYSAAHDASRAGTLGYELYGSPLFLLQSRANHLFYGRYCEGGKVSRFADADLGACDVRSAIKYQQPDDARVDALLARLDAIPALLARLGDEFRAGN